MELFRVAPGWKLLLVLVAVFPGAAFEVAVGLLNVFCLGGRPKLHQASVIGVSRDFRKRLELSIAVNRINSQ